MLAFLQLPAGDSLGSLGTDLQLLKGVGSPCWASGRKVWVQQTDSSAKRALIFWRGKTRRARAQWSVNKKCHIFYVFSGGETPVQ